MRFTPALFLTLASLASTALAADSLPSGQYYIVNADQKTRVGRSFIEDLSLLPKPVVANPNAERWNVTSLGDDKYILSHRGAPVKGLDGAIFAYLLPEVIEQWVVQRQVHSGAFTIVSSDTSKGWILRNNEQNTQVSYNYLKSTDSDPPQFPTNELWQFQTEA